MEYKGLFYKGPIELGDTVVVWCGDDKPDDKNVGEQFTGTVISIAGNIGPQIFEILDENNYVFIMNIIPKPTDSEIFSRKPGSEKVKVSEPKEIAQKPQSDELSLHKEKMYGRQIKMENNSLPPKSQRPFEFL